MDKENRKHGWRVIALVIAAVVLATVAAALLIFNDLFGRMKAPPIEETLPQATATQPEKIPAEEPPREEETLPPEPEISGETDAELEASIQETIQNIEVEIPNTDGVMSVLLLGNDTRDVPIEQRTDCVFLASVNQNTRQILLVSFPRELDVYVPDWGRTEQLISVHVNGDPMMMAATIQQNFGVAIDAYLSISFESFEHAVDTFGGVDMALSADDLSALTGKGFSPASNGTDTYHLDGAQTLAYCQGRSSDSGSDHTNRQYTVIRKVWEKSKTASLKARYNVLQQTLQAVSTTLTRNQCLKLLLDMPLLYSGKMLSHTLPVADQQTVTAYLQEWIYNE